MKIDRKSPEFLILLMTIGAAISWAVWLNLLNNFAIEKIDFTGAEIGVLQSLREIPGFLAFTVILVLAFIREQKLAYISLVILGIGVMLTGLVQTNMTFYLATIVMSVGFHYFETINGSLTLQWVDKDKTAEFLGSYCYPLCCINHSIQLSLVIVSAISYGVFMDLYDWWWYFCRHSCVLLASFLLISRKS